MTNVAFLSFCKVFMRSIKVFADFESKSPVGSSASMTEGLCLLIREIIKRAKDMGVKLRRAD